MKCTRIYLERTKSLPGYNNKKVGIELELSEVEKAIDVLKHAEIFVANALNESPSPEQMQIAFKMTEFQKSLEDLPF